MGQMSRGWRFWLRIAAVIGLGTMAVFVALIYLSRFEHPETTPIVIGSQPALQPTIDYLATHPDDSPEGLHIDPPPGKVGVEKLCVRMVVLPCEGEKNRMGLPPEQNHCGPDMALTVDGQSPQVFNEGELGLTQIDGHWYTDAQTCLVSILAPGSHLLTIKANPMGRAVRYSWVWTVGP